MSTDLTGIGVLVTGGTSGLGAETARTLSRAGAHVTIAGRNEDAGKALADEIGEGAQYVQTDVTDEEQVAAAVEASASAPRGLRLAVSAAGVATVAKTLGRDGSAHPLAPFQQMLDVNLVGAFNLLRLSAAQMATNEPDEDGGRGAVVLTSSVGAYEGQMGQIAYAASKGGIVAMVLPAARDLARSGIGSSGSRRASSTPPSWTSSARMPRPPSAPPSRTRPGSESPPSTPRSCNTSRRTGC